MRLQVLGLDQFLPGHKMGSSHGDTRIFRMAYHEHPSYVPLLQKSLELWRELESESGKVQNCEDLVVADTRNGLVSSTSAAAHAPALGHRLWKSGICCCQQNLAKGQPCDQEVTSGTIAQPPNTCPVLTAVPMLTYALHQPDLDRLLFTQAFVPVFRMHDQW